MLWSTVYDPCGITAGIINSELLNLEQKSKPQLNTFMVLPPALESL